MSTATRTRWTQQLAVSELDPSWKARVEKRVLRFVLSCYGEPREAPVLTPLPFFWTDSPAGEARVSPTPRQLHRKLGHIARVMRECRQQPTVCLFDWLFGTVEYVPPSKPVPLENLVAETIEDLEDFVACQVEKEAASRFQEGVRPRREEMRW